MTKAADRVSQSAAVRGLLEAAKHADATAVLVADLIRALKVALPHVQASTGPHHQAHAAFIASVIHQAENA